MDAHPAPDAEAARERAGRLRLIVGLLALVAVFWLFIGSMVDGGGAYFLTVDEAVAKVGTLEGNLVRIKGKVAEGTWQHTEGSTDHAFSIHENGKLMPVRYTGPMPDVFAEGREVVAEGRYENGTLVATEIVAKCPSKYEGGKVPPEMKAKMANGS